MFSGQNGKCWYPFTGLGYTFEVDGGRFAVGKEEAEAEGHTETDSTPVVSSNLAVGEDMRNL